MTALTFCTADFHVKGASYWITDLSGGMASGLVDER
jgi:hypothetical protein